MQCIECPCARLLLSLFIMGGICGCNQGDPNKGLKIKPGIHVTGTVLVDGKAPDTPLQVKAYPVGSSAEEQAPSFGATGAEGVFELSTYNSGDGIPAGEYKFTFQWTGLRLGGSALGGGPSDLDKLGGQYADPATSPFIVTVVESSDVVDLGTFELKKSATPTKPADDRSR